MSGARRSRRTPSNTIVAFSVSYQREQLLERGMGLEHLKELVARLARPIVSDGRSVAYAGSWKPSPENFTQVLLRIISAEQDDTSDDAEQNPDAARTIAPLINHLAWPHYLTVTPRIEADAINSCRILRVTQEQVGLADICPDSEAAFESDRAVFNAAVTLSAMRRLQVEGMTYTVVPGEKEESVPPIAARILIGGKIADSSGFAPGVFEEALLMLEAKRPTYVLGGFGGASKEIADLFLGVAPLPSMSVERLEGLTPGLVRLNKLARARLLPSGVRDTAAIIAGLCAAAPPSPSTLAPIAHTFNTGLDEDDTRILMTTSDLDTALRLVLRGLRAHDLVQHTD